MGYRVFISHSARDQGQVIALSHLLSEFGVEVSVAEWYLIPGQPLDQKVFRQIDDSDCIVVLLTRDGVRSTWVQHEIGYALAKPKLILPLVEKGTDPTDLGALAGKDYIEYDPHRYDAALITASSYVKSLKLKKEEQAKALLVAGGILAFLLLLSGRAEMNSISYIPSKDQLALRLAPSRGKATWESARFRLWWDNQGNISGIDISLESSSDKS